MIYTHVAAFLAGLAMAATAAWHIQAWRYDAQIADIKAAQAQALALASEETARNFRAITTKYQGALNAATERETKLRADADTARRTVDGLRGTLYEFRASLPGASTAALITRADTAAELFGACVNEYRSVAESADRHAADAVMLIEAWPSNVGR